MASVPPFIVPSHCPPSPVTCGVLGYNTTQESLPCWKSQPWRKFENTGYPSHQFPWTLPLLRQGISQADLANTASALQSHDLFQQGKHPTWGKRSVKVAQLSMGQDLLLPSVLPKAHSVLSREDQQGMKAALHVPCQQQKGQASATTRKAGWKQTPQTHIDIECQNTISGAFLGFLIRPGSFAEMQPACALHGCGPRTACPPLHSSAGPETKEFILLMGVSLVWRITHWTPGSFHSW